MDARTDQNGGLQDGPATGTNGRTPGGSAGEGRGKRRTKKRGNVIDFTPSPPKEPTSPGLNTRDSNPSAGRDGEAAAARAAERISHMSETAAQEHVERTEKSEGAILPFDNTLAYAFRLIGGKLTAINASRLVAPVDARFARLVMAYDKATDTDKRVLTLEGLCEAAGILPGEFLGIITRAIYERNQDSARLMVAFANPDVVAATIDNAKNGGDKGFRDRQLLHEHTGFSQPKQGPVINLNSGNTTEIDARTISVTLPEFDTELKEAATATRGDASMTSVGGRRGQRAIEAPPIRLTRMDAILEAEPVEES